MLELVVLHVAGNIGQLHGTRGLGRAASGALQVSEALI